MERVCLSQSAWCLALRTLLTCRVPSPASCITWLGNFVSWVDLLHILTMVSLLLFFLFVRNEYFVYCDSFVWTTNQSAEVCCA
jgi:hypothetical protein